MVGLLPYDTDFRRCRRTSSGYVLAVRCAVLRDGTGRTYSRHREPPYSPDVYARRRGRSYVHDVRILRRIGAKSGGATHLAFPECAQAFLDINELAIHAR
jgi:hypothetical protein